MKKICSLLLTLTVLFSIPIVNAEAFTIGDARYALRMAVNLEELDLNYDINNDGEVSTNDARLILRQTLGLKEPEPEPEKPKYEQEFPFVGKGVCVPSGVTAEILANALQYNLKDYAEYFIEAEQTYGINAIFIAAIAAHESGWGRSYLALNKNNLFGWKGGSGFKYFNSIREGIMQVSRSLKVNYLSPDGCYFNGYTVEAVSIYYCDSTWARYINSMMSYIENRC